MNGLISPKSQCFTSLAALAVACAFATLPRAIAQTTAPGDAPSDLELRATQAFNSRQYAIALPILKQVESQLAQAKSDRLPSVQEEIRVCQTNIAAITDAAKSAAAAPQSLSSNRVPHARPAPGAPLSCTIKELGNFDYDADKGGNIPADVLALTGSHVRLHGFMIPMDQAQTITQFALVPDLFSCCFGQPPQLQHTVVVNCPAGKAVSYYPDEITVDGTLTVEEKKDEGFIVSIFSIDVSSVKPSPK